MAFLGHPKLASRGVLIELRLVGDVKYGPKSYQLDMAVSPRIFLHCLRMEFEDMDGEPFIAASELAVDLQMALCELQRLSCEQHVEGISFPGATRSGAHLTA